MRDVYSHGHCRCNGFDAVHAGKAGLEKLCKSDLHPSPIWTPILIALEDPWTSKLCGKMCHLDEGNSYMEVF